LPSILHPFPTRRSSDLEAGSFTECNLSDCFKGRATRASPVLSLYPCIEPRIANPCTEPVFALVILHQISVNTYQRIVGIYIRGSDRKSTRLNSSHVKIS